MRPAPTTPTTTEANKHEATPNYQTALKRTSSANKMHEYSNCISQLQSAAAHAISSVGAGCLSPSAVNNSPGAQLLSRNSTLSKSMKSSLYSTSVKSQEGTKCQEGGKGQAPLAPSLSTFKESSSAKKCKISLFIQRKKIVNFKNLFLFGFLF